MRLSVSKRPSPFQEGDLQDEQRYHEDSKVLNGSVGGGEKPESPFKASLTNSQEKLNQAKLACSANNETTNNALMKLMNNRHRQEDVLDQLDRIYTCNN